MITATLYGEGLKREKVQNSAKQSVSESTTITPVPVPVPVPQNTPNK
jgi:hypothetical protein